MKLRNGGCEASLTTMRGEPKFPAGPLIPASLAPAGTKSALSKPHDVLAIAVAAVLVYASASPVPSPTPRHPAVRHTAAPKNAAADGRAMPASPRPAPSPEPSNPFTLAPGANPSSPPLPQIGRTRSRGICSALRQAVAPAVQAAMANDKTYGDLRKSVYDYTVYGNETSRDLKLMQMDRGVHSLVKNTDDLETALNSHAFDVPPNASSSDAQAITDIRKTMRGVLEAQKVQLDAMSGFVETERMRRFGTKSESEGAMAGAVAGDRNSSSRGGAFSTPSPSTGFLRDSSMIFKAPPGRIALDDAHHLDHDLGDIAAFTAKREDAASKIIIPATSLCK
ncbi:MAG: hypothetical protein NVS3B7_05230 [Candidatus Elarobacter sp.]